MIEIETAFELRPEDEPKLIAGATFVGEEHHDDEFFDTADMTLGCQDIWLRRRNGKFELKIPSGQRGSGKLVTAQYTELVTDEDIAHALGVSAQRDLEMQLTERGFERIFSLSKDRKTYRRDPFTIVVDTFDTGVMNAEVEVMVTSNDEAPAAHQKIQTFLNELQIATPPVQGRLLDYLQSSRPDLYAKLKAAGILW